MTDVPINPVTRRVQFTGNTGTGPYAFTFNILQASDIAVFKNTATLTLTNDYTVAINANGTGAVTLVAALIASDLLTITGGRELSRTTDFVTGGPLLAGTLNEQLDSNVIMSQQLDEKFDRSLKIAQSDFTANLTLPIKSVRANQLLGFDASGNAVAGTGSTLNLTVANLTASSLTIPIGGSTVIEGFSFDSGKISTTITNDPLELYSNGTGTVIASPSLTVDNLKLDGNTFSSINSNGDINIFPNGSGTVNMDADLMVYGNDVNGVASYVQISASATGGDDIRLQGSNPVVASYDTSNVSAQTPSMLGAFSLYGKDTSGNYIAYATLRGYAEDPFAGTNGKEGSLRIQINDDSSIREHKFTATGLDVYNNITLSGTVDGRDIASDGSKLDGITANATTYSFSDTNGTVTVTPAQGSAATLIIGTAAGSGGLAMRGNAGGADSVALGTSSNAIGVNAITIGKSATTSTGSNSPTNGIAIGEQAHSYGSGTTALGRQASSIGDNSIALGSYASVPATYHSSVALGYQATVNAANQIMLGTSNKTVKIPGALTVDGNITASGTVDGRDIATDGTKLNTIETNADVTDATNVAAAGALMKSGGAMTGAITTNSTFDGRDVATDGTKLDGIEASADITDATNVNAAGAVMVADTSTSGMGFVVDEDNMGSNSATKIPTQQSVKAYVDLNVSSSVQYRGSYNAATNSPNLDSSPSGITIGDMYTTTVAGTFYSTGLEIGDVLIAEVDDPSSVNDWTIVQQNLDAASIKSLYESNADTNAFDDAEQTRLAGIEAGAEVNAGQYFMISANSQGVANGEIITTFPNASGQTSEVIDFTGAGGLTVARAGNNLTFTSANTTYGFADENGTVTITPSTGSAATLVIGTAAGSGGLAFRGNAGGANSIALGTSSNSMGINSIIIGNDAESTASGSGNSNNIGIGYQAHPYGANAIAIGYQAVAAGASGTALGPYANVPSSYYNSTALGISATVTASNQIMLGTSGTAVNVPGTLSATGNSTFGGTVTATGVIVDNITIDGNDISTTNTNGNLTITPNGTGNVNINTDTLAVTAASNESASLLLTADNANHHPDIWRISSNTSNTLTIGNQISGSIVDHITITPNATVANSVTAFAGNATFAGAISLGVAGASNGYINSPSGIFVNIDSDNNQTDRFFDIRKDSTDGSGALLFQVLESGATTINGNVTVDGGTTTSLIIEKDNTGSGRVAFHNAGTQISYISLDASEDMVYYAGSGVDQIFYAHGAQALTLTSGAATFAGTVTATTLQTTAGGTVTTASGNDLNIVYPNSRSLFFKEGSTTTLTLDNAQNATFAGSVTAAKSIVKTASNDTFTIETVNTGGALSAHTTLTNSDGNVYFKVGTENALTLGLNGGVDLYYNNELKFNTHVSGARVTSNLSLYSTDATASNGPDLILTRNSATPAASDDLGNIQFFGESSTSVSTQYGHIRSEISSPTQNATKGNMYIDALDTDGTLYTGIGIHGKVAKLYYADGERLATTSAGINVTGSVTSTGLVLSNAAGANKQFLNSGTTTTGANYININNTGGAYYLGAENSSGNELGSTAYDFVMQAPSSRAINLMVGAGRARLTSTGIDVTGTVTATGSNSSTSDWGNENIISKSVINAANRTYGGLILQDSAINSAGVGFRYDGTGYKLELGTASSTSSGISTHLTIDRVGSIVTSGHLDIGANLGVTGTATVNYGTTASYVGTFTNTADNLELKIGTTTGGLLNIQGANASSNAAYQIALNAEGGNVGIGTSSPSTTLQVNASGGGNLLVSRTGTTGGLYIESDGTNGVIRNPANAPLHFQTNNANTRMTILGGGNVGIGRTAPASIFEVHMATNKNIGFSGGQGELGSIPALVAYTDAGSTTDIGFRGATVRFANTSAEAMRIDSSGNVDIKTGNLVIGTSGKGIDFSAQAASGGATAELLDHYEEGTWTPAIASDASATAYTTQVGFYTRIGSIVHVSATLQVSNLGSFAGAVINLTGLPFTISDATNYNPIGSLVLDGTATAKENIFLRFTLNTEMARLEQANGQTTHDNNMNANAFDTGTILKMSGSYIAK